GIGVISLGAIVVARGNPRRARACRLRPVGDAGEGARPTKHPRPGTRCRFGSIMGGVRIQTDSGSGGPTCRGCGRGNSAVGGAGSAVLGSGVRAPLVGSWNMSTPAEPDRIVENWTTGSLTAEQPPGTPDSVWY